MTLSRGSWVKVTGGIRVPRHTEGAVFWLGVCRFKRRPRCGIRTLEGNEHFLYVAEVEIVVPEVK